ncbi:penicillin-binding protein [Campylobacter sp. RM13119]|uniref:LPS assembly lipoprotein LptE n=1 Tax=Campylobacter californiensis TaxID=1032243 RepID=UPI0014766F99|nr:LPS assembly lipoprotein LptE [Campylobacter sp. RM13119]MBE3606291.1 penicillin-binding protein [Campylobacter sp. RM13119]
MKFFISVFMALMLAGCGYKPVSKITKEMTGESVYVDVIISKTEPKNSVWVKDAVKDGVVSRLNKTLSDDQNADMSIIISVGSLSYQAAVYDQYGYITSYRAILNLNFKTRLKDGSVVNITTSGEHDFSIARRLQNTRYADSVISDTERYEAIKEASKDAFDEYIANLALKGYQNGSRNR